MLKYISLKERKYYQFFTELLINNFKKNSKTMIFNFTNQMLIFISIIINVNSRERNL